MQNPSFRDVHALLLQSAFPKQLRLIAHVFRACACRLLRLMAKSTGLCQLAAPLHMLRGDVLLDYGCLRPRPRGSFACAYFPSHACVRLFYNLGVWSWTSPASASRPPDYPMIITCDAARSPCESELAAGGAAWKCALRCPWLVCHVCATSRALEQGSFGVLPGQEMQAVVRKLTEQTLAQTRGAASYSEEVVLADVQPCERGGAWPQPVLWKNTYGTCLLRACTPRAEDDLGQGEGVA